MVDIRPEERTKYDESVVVNDLLSELTGNDVFWDIGANVGLYSVQAADICKTVFAFEPVSRNVDYLVENAQKNGVRQNVFVIQVALSNRGGFTGFQLTDNESDAPSLGKVDPEETDLVVPILPGFAFGSVRPDVVKVDTEGTEADVIRGLGRMPRVMYVEVHGTAPHRNTPNDPDEVYDVIRDRGGDVEVLLERTNETIIKVT